MFAIDKMPYITTMIQTPTPDEFIAAARNAVCGGADAIGFQLCQLKKEYRTEENYRNMFAYVGDRPIYITNYDRGFSEGDSDDELVDGLKLALECGADLADIPGDMFHKEKYQLTRDKIAIEKQMRLIDEIHSMGKQVLMSSHIFEFRSIDDLTEIANEQIKRGADVVKIVAASNTEDELLENLKSESELKRRIKKPFLFLSTGLHCKKHRMLGPYFGSCMWLTVYEYGAIDNKEQPLLKSVKAVRDNFDTTLHLRSGK